MRKLSWMVVIVLVGGGFLGVTRFAGMWGGPDEKSIPGVSDSLAGQRWQFERLGEDDGITNLARVVDEELRLPFGMRRGEQAAAAKTAKHVVAPEPLAATMLDSAPAAADTVRPAIPAHRVETATQPLANSEVVPAPPVQSRYDAGYDFDTAAQPVIATPAVEPEVETSLTTVEWELMETAYAAETIIEGPAVASAASMTGAAGDIVMSMSVMGAASDVGGPKNAYDSPIRTYVVSPPVASASDRGPVYEPRPQDKPLTVRPQRATVDGLAGLHGVIDATYVSRFIWRGYDIYENNHSAFQPSVDLDLFGTGFGVSVWISRANGSGFEDSKWLTFTGYYGGALFAGEAHAMHFRVGYRYYSYPDTPRRGNPLIRQTADAQEIFGEFAWPNLLPWGIVPEYEVFAYWPSVSGSTARNDGGWGHLLGFSKNITFESIFGNQPEQVVRLGAHAFYNDGFGPAGEAADHDWSHAVFSVSTDFDLGSGFIFVPGFNYQSSWDDSVNTSDEYWTSLSVQYRF